MFNTDKKPVSTEKMWLNGFGQILIFLDAVQPFAVFPKCTPAVVCVFQRVVMVLDDTENFRVQRFLKRNIV